MNTILFLLLEHITHTHTYTNTITHSNNRVLIRSVLMLITEIDCFLKICVPVVVWSDAERSNLTKQISYNLPISEELGMEEIIQAVAQEHYYSVGPPRSVQWTWSA